ncbi:uncharacterized protein LOC115446270 [Manduca sexta]|uniref:Uncharacterized protein n=1 Tax=Manduca sexta TaxID=7130 RepID=A0A921ZBE5_MANSE|nr:uncharacterized protein LOC115446270 [Manduca sexta]KAG6454420.1 hypothetical protein O3G_MSEX008694 [Manduca sexta]
MTVYIAGFICALVLAALVLAWIAYCMFVRERHKSEVYQYSISDLQHRNYLMSQTPENEKKEEKELTVGYFVLPSRKHKEEDYNNRPDYPESPVPISQPSTDKLIEILNEEETHYKDGIYEVDSKVMYSEV